MFTGIIQEYGSVFSLTARPGARRVEIQASSRLCAGLSKGASIACNGVCLTVVAKRKNIFACDLLPETIRRTTFHGITKGDTVNLELPLRAGDELGGHIVQGHVDGVGVVCAYTKRRNTRSAQLSFSVPARVARFVTNQGSIAVNGVSLTVVKIAGTTVTVSLTPYTLAHTNLQQCRAGDRVNIEVDILAKYVR